MPAISACLAAQVGLASCCATSPAKPLLPCPALDEVARTGAIVNMQDVQAPADEATGFAGRFLRFVCAPIRLEDGDATICQGFDITHLHNSQRRQAALASLGEKISELEDPDELAFSAAEILGRTLRVGRAGYGTIDLANETIHIERDWTMPGRPSLAGTLRFRDYGSYIDDLKLGRTVVFDDARVDPRTTANADALCAIQARSVVNMPVTEQGGFVALLYLNDAEARHWTQEELALDADGCRETQGGSGSASKRSPAWLPRCSWQGNSCKHSSRGHYGRDDARSRAVSWRLCLRLR